LEGVGELDEEFVSEFFVGKLEGGYVGVVAGYLGQDRFEEQHDECVLLAGIVILYGNVLIVLDEECR